MTFCKHESHAGYCNKKGNRLCTLGCKEAEMIEVEEVVRCKDCKYWGDEEFAEGGYRICCCEDKDYATNEPSKKFVYFPVTVCTDFCSYGERKDEE